MFHKVTRSLFASFAAIVVGTVVIASTPSISYAAPKKSAQTLSIPKHNINKALKEACLPGGLFDGMVNVVDVFGRITAILNQIDAMLGSIFKGLIPGWDPRKCFPNLDPSTWINFDPNFLNKCIDIPKVSCTFPTDYNPEEKLKECLEGAGSINLPPGLDPDKIAQCVIPDMPNLPSISDIMGIFQSIFDQLNQQLISISGILNARNIKLLDWFVNFCGEVNRGSIKVTTEKVKVGSSKKK